ncbi:MAG TPA: cyclin-dependent kinase inhibitor 3 family protein, partial [Myxococcota bacterium]|nr:cyclin-dependent kinase inhibitor 3 family protein [Myxococcota bacterium]
SADRSLQRHARPVAAQRCPAPAAAPSTRTRTSFTDPIEVAWLPGPLSGRIGLTFAPGKRSGSLFGSPWHRDLGADLDRLRASHRVDLLVPLVEDFELRDLGISRLVEEAEARGIVVGRLAIPDGGIPALEDARRIVDWILAFARAGRVAVVHCRGGLGRAGTLAACSLTRLGYRPAEAIAAVRKVRPGALENSGQEDFVHLFAKDVSRE